MKDINEYRNFLKSELLKNLKNIETDQEKEVPEPSLQKSCIDNSPLINLTPPNMFTCGVLDLLTILRKRKSRRDYSNTPLTIEELSFLLWSTQGVKKIVRNGYATLRTVPSAGARHPFETYLAIFNVENLEKGIYRYLPLEHKLILIQKLNDLENKLLDACFDQTFIVQSAVTFIWTAIPYRTEWRYSQASFKLIALDAGHMCQNLYLASEAINAGTCAVASYDQEKIDSLLNVDGKEEFTIYLAPVGKID